MKSNIFYFKIYQIDWQNINYWIQISFKLLINNAHNMIMTFVDSSSKLNINE